AMAGQINMPATYMRGGTSKGVLFRRQELPQAAQQPGEARDKVLLRVIGSPDPYGKHTDGMGGATSSTSKTVILSPATVPDHDVDYLFGQVSIDKPFIDWSGNCGNLTDRKSTRLNSSHVSISYAVFCLKKKIKIINVLYIHAH